MQNRTLPHKKAMQPLAFEPPLELCRLVAEYLHTYDAVEVAQVSKHWSRAVRSCEWLWHTCRIASHYLEWHAMAMTRTKRKRETIFVEPVLWAKGNYLLALTIGLKSAPAPIVLQNSHMHAIATHCTSLRKLKVFVHDADLTMDAMDLLTASCKQLVSVALPVSAISVMDVGGDVFGCVNSRIQVMRLSGDALLYSTRHSSWKRMWLGPSLVRLKLVNIYNFDQTLLTAMLSCVPTLRELLIFDCVAVPGDASVNAHLLHDVTSMWLVHFANQLRVLALVNSDTVICSVFVLNSLFTHAPLEWPHLGTLMLNSNVLDTAGQENQLKALMSCPDCSTYIKWHMHHATEATRCSACRQRFMAQIHTVLLY